MNVGWLIKTLQKYGKYDSEIFIEISGVKFPLCGKIDISFLTYTTPDNLSKEMMQEILCFYPCECSSKEEDDKKAVEFPLN